MPDQIIDVRQARGTGLVAVVLLTVVAAVMLVGAVALHGDVNNRLLLVALAVAFGSLALAIARTRLTADDAGIHLRGPLRRRDLAWPDVASICVEWSASRPVALIAVSPGGARTMLWSARVEWFPDGPRTNELEQLAHTLSAHLPLAPAPEPQLVSDIAADVLAESDFALPYRLPRRSLLGILALWMILAALALIGGAVVVRTDVPLVPEAGDFWRFIALPGVVLLVTTILLLCKSPPGRVLLDANPDWVEWYDGSPHRVNWEDVAELVPTGRAAGALELRTSDGRSFTLPPTRGAPADVVAARLIARRGAAPVRSSPGA